MTTLYLHGFCSSPKSNKALLLREAHAELGIKFIAPELHVGPVEAMKIIWESIKEESTEHLIVLGSSLGGYYATWLAEKLGVPAILFNPAVHPQCVISDNLGFHKVPDTDITLEVVPAHVEELDRFRVDQLKVPTKYLVLLGDEDEVLDWTEGRDFYVGAEQWIFHGEDHRLSNFKAYVPEIMKRVVLFA